MRQSFQVAAKVRFARVLSSACVLWLTFASLLAAHEVYPTVVTMEQAGDTLVFVAGPDGLGANLEAFVAGIDLSAVTDTNDAEQGARYDELRAMEPAEFEQAFRDYWPEMAAQIVVRAGDTILPLSLTDVQIAEVGNVEFLRPSVISFTATIPSGTSTVTVDWASTLGGLVLRQEGVESPYDAYLTNGQVSGPIALQPSGVSIFGWPVGGIILVIVVTGAALLSRRRKR